jgi:hypothetical protein
MANTDGLYTVDQLRSEIGSPTADPREPGAVLDSELQGIIDREESTLDSMILSRLEKRSLESVPITDQKAHEETTVSLVNETSHAEGSVDDKFYAITFFEGEGPNDNFFEYDPNLQVESVGFFERRRFTFVSNKALVIPADTSTIDLYLPVKTKVRSRMGGLVAKANSKILELAQSMAQSKAQQGERLERSDLDQ